MNQQTLWSHHQVKAQKNTIQLSFFHPFCSSLFQHNTHISHQRLMNHMHAQICVCLEYLSTSGWIRASANFFLFNAIFFPMHQPICLFPSLVCSLSLSLLLLESVSSFSREQIHRRPKRHQLA